MYKQIPILVLLHFFFTASLVSQPSFPKNFIVSSWTTNEGLPQNSINDIIQTKDGFIWMATFGGLVRFDGVTFTVIDLPNESGLNSNRILKLFEDSEGGIWLFPENTETVLIRYLHDEFETFHFDSKFSTRLDLYEDKNRNLWLMAFNKPFKFKNRKFIEVPIVSDIKSVQNAVSNRDGIWISGLDKVFRTSGDSVAAVYDLNSRFGLELVSSCEFPKGSGTIFIGTNASGIIKMQNGEFAVFNKGNGLPINNFLMFRTDHKNNLFAIMTGKIAIWNGSRFETIAPIKSTGDVLYNCILEDNEGNYWIGTSGDGLYRLRPTHITAIDGNQGLQNEKMLSLEKLRNGIMLFGTNGNGIYEWKNNRAVPSAINSFLSNWCVWSVFQDSKDRIWVGTRGLYLTNSLHKKGIVIDRNDGKGIGNNEVFSITEDTGNNIWIGAANGLYKYDEKELHRYTTDDGLYYNDTRALFQDASGTIWVGTKAGLNKISNGVISKVRLSGNMENPKSVIEPGIRAIYQDKEGAIWIGTYGNGLFRLKNGEVHNITEKNGLFDNIVSHIAEDSSGYFWMGSNRGISRVARTDLNDFCNGKITAVHSFSYSTADGMKTAETNGGFQPNIIQDSDGKIYFPTVKGIAVVSTGKVFQNTLAPPVEIVSVNNRNLETQKSDINLPYDSSTVEIRYTAMSYSDPLKVKFKYRLEGLDNTWIRAGTQRNVIYPGIPPGTYIFTVTACNNDGVWNEKGASIKIIITPPFWKTTWFIFAVIFILITTAPTILYFRISRLNDERKKQDKFAELLIDSQETERRRIASELHDGLSQQILVIKSRAELAMKSIQDSGKTLEHLQEITNSAISSINDVRSITHDLRPVYLEQFGLTDTLKNLIEQVRQSSEIKWVYHIDKIDGIIKSEKEINFYRIVQEGINNILKHSEATQASVMIRLIEENLIASLWDNGKGFDIDEKKKSSGLGLTGILERTKSLGGWLELKSEPNEGTTLKIIIRMGENG